MTLALEVAAADVDRAEPIWRTIEPRATASYFLSWGWTENSLACLPAAARPQLAVVRDDGVPVAACLLGRQRTRRHHLVPCRAAFVNATGVARYDELVIEHNDVLRVADGPTLQDLVARLPGDWDEIYLPGIEAAALPGERDGWSIVIDREVPAPYVDLDVVRASAGGYLALLGRETRGQLRRSARGLGDLAVEQARDAAEATRIFDELVELHTASWQLRGQAGAFADPWFTAFHRRLIATRFGASEIQLLRITAGGRTLGCLYNFVFRGSVLFYQSGLVQDPSPHVKPGYTSHAAAIEHAARAGHLRYDFLAGDGRYKRSLATAATRLIWARIRRPRLAFALEDRLRSAWRAGCSHFR